MTLPWCKRLPVVIPKLHAHSWHVHSRRSMGMFSRSQHPAQNEGVEISIERTLSPCTTLLMGNYVIGNLGKLCKVTLLPEKPSRVELRSPTLRFTFTKTRSHLTEKGSQLRYPGFQGRIFILKGRSVRLEQSHTGFGNLASGKLTSEPQCLSQCRL